MSSERMIDRLVGDLAPVRPISLRRDAWALAALGAVEVALFVLLGQARPDLDQAMLLPSFWWKLGGMAMLAVIGVVATLRSFVPTGSPHRGLRLFAIVTALVLVAGWAIDVGQTGGGALAERLMWRDGLACVFAMVVLSLPPAVALAVMMRRGAPVDRGASALAAGLASAAWGAAIFVLNCPHDDPLYLAVWYVIGCALIAVAIRQVFLLVARW